MRISLQLLSTFGFVRHRLRSHLGLLLAVWAGLTLAVGIVTSIPMYAEAAGYRILLSALKASDEEDQVPPFSLIYTYEGSSGPSLTWARYRQVDALASDLRRAGIDVPPQRQVRYAATERLGVMWDRDGEALQMMTARLAFVSGFEENVQLLDGERPRPWNGAGPMDVWVSDRIANEKTLLVGDVFRMQAALGIGAQLNVPVRVAGTWRPINEDSDYWFYPPMTFNQMVIAPEASFGRALGNPALAKISYATWYTALDSTAVRSEDVSGLLAQMEGVTENLQRLLPGIALRTSPTEAMLRHRDQVRLLTVTLALFSVPLLALIGYFIAQLAGMVVQRQQQEIAVLRSRGSSRVQVVALALGEGLALAGAALLVGVPLGLAIAQVLVWTEGFLRFAPLPGPPIGLLDASWRHGLYALLLALPAILLPGLRASGRTIIGFKQERARVLRPPLWRRTYLDVALLLVALYGLQQLRRNGLVGVPGVAAAADDPFRNPILMLAPALFVFALALVALRLLPLLLAILGRVFGRSRGIAVLTLHSLSRSTQMYSSVILLITLTLSLAAYTATMARTLNGHSVARARYSAGADLRLAYKPPEAQAVSSSSGGSGGTSSTPGGTPVEGVGESAGEATDTSTGAASDSAAGGSPAPASGASGGTEYLTTPVDDYLKIRGVKAVTRVAPSDVYIAPNGGTATSGIFLGVDHASLGAVLAESWREDYASESLGALLNRLATDPGALLVSSRYAQEQRLNVGDRLTLQMNDVGQTQEVPFVVAGIVDYFPTLYPEAAPFVIGNLDYSYDSQGGTYRYQVWMDLAPGASIQEIANEAYTYQLFPLENTPGALLEADLLRPERQGLFGLLSVGFLAAGMVTIIGFLASTLVGFQRRLVEMGTLRAMGLSTRQLASMLVGEQALVIGVGAAAGTALGVLASRLFVPFLQVRSGEFPDTPSFLVRVAWEQIAVVCGVAAAMLVLAVVITLALLRRLRIFEAVKLGEAV
ncbi:MAG: ABC transporter permease [Chloroflexota bacterium]|nr:ABC transporter permease [Chloroflexota bacterium]